MPSLSLVLDYPLKISQEPGFHRQISAGEVATAGAPNPDGSSSYLLWTDPQTHTLMLRPLQLNRDWINSTFALPYIVRLAQLNVNPSDLTNLTLFEQPVLGNTANPWVYHHPTLPASYFPSAHEPEAPVPESGPSLVGIAPGVDVSTADLMVVRPNAGYALPSVMTAFGSDPAPIQVISTAAGIHVGQSGFRLAANQGLFLRWYQPSSALGFPQVHRWYIGQFLVDIKESVVQVFQDTSSGGDRSSYGHIGTYFLFAQGDNPGEVYSPFAASMTGDETAGHIRSLMWLPFRRNQILLQASTGRSALIQARAVPRRLPDNSDWDIVRSDTLLLWLIAPTWGFFQIQKLAFQPLAVANLPPIYLDYAPSVTPSTALSVDADHGTVITAAQSSPPSYNLPINNTAECQPVPAGASSTIQARTYGYQLTLQSDLNDAWTPFFYNLRLDSSPILAAPVGPTPLTINDVTAAGQGDLISAKITSGLKAGDGRADIELLDPNPYPLAGYYYRCGMPIQLALDGTAVFTGYTLPSGVEPVRPLGRNNPVRLHLTAADRWWQLTNFYLRDNRNWAGVGHIEVVQNILQQAGVDIAGMDTFALTDPQNAILGDLTQNQVANEAALQTLSPWQPHPAETAATFLRRIADHFAGWNLGFYPDGTCFYRPRYHFTASEVTFYETRAIATAAGHPSAPLYRNATFSVIEPEANIIMVKAISRQTGGPLYSSVWVDWASLQNTSAVNYLGRRKVEIVEIAGAYSCAGINWAARQIWNWTRRRHIIARFDTDYSALPKVGHVLTLNGYGDYRVASLTINYHKRTNNWLSIEAEFVESGHQ